MHMIVLSLGSCICKSLYTRVSRAHISRLAPKRRYANTTQRRSPLAAAARPALPGGVCCRIRSQFIPSITHDTSRHLGVLGRQL